MILFNKQLNADAQENVAASEEAVTVPTATTNAPEVVTAHDRFRLEH
jgi:hypothetical protein